MKNFTLSLYAFHLCQSFSNTLDEVDESASQLWENLVQLGNNTFPFHGLKDLRSHLICYTNNTYDSTPERRQKTFKLTNCDDIDLGSVSTAEGFQIHANLQAFRLHDTYAVDLTIYPDETQDIDIPQLQLFQPQYLLPTTIQASLGQTLWLYGEVIDGTPDECLEIAKKCAVALLAGTAFNPVLENQGNLFGSLLFEFQASHFNPPDNFTQNPHLFICLNYRQSATIDLASQGYDWLLEFLCCYHKINFVYSQATQRYREARHLYSQLEKNMDELSGWMENREREIRLKKLKEKLKKLSKYTLRYTQCLGDLQAHYTALATNTTNYEICLKKLENLGEIPPCWQDFIHQSRDRDLVQIQTHLDYLSPTSAAFQEAIEIIRGTVDIEQAELDRASEDAAQNRQQRLELVLTFISTGLAVSGLSSQVANEPAKTLVKKVLPSYFSAESQLEFPQDFFFSSALIIFHLLLGIFAAIPIGVLFWSLQANVVRKIFKFFQK